VGGRQRDGKQARAAALAERLGIGGCQRMLVDDGLGTLIDGGTAPVDHTPRVVAVAVVVVSS